MAKTLVGTYDRADTFLYITVCNLRTLTDELAHYIQQLLKAELLADKLYCKYICSEIIDLSPHCSLQPHCRHPHCF